jgi:hypothetical protein
MTRSQSAVDPWAQHVRQFVDESYGSVCGRMRLVEADRWSGADPDPALEETVVAVELEASRREPYRSMSRLFHLPDRRTSPVC